MDMLSPRQRSVDVPCGMAENYTAIIIEVREMTGGWSLGGNGGGETTAKKGRVEALLSVRNAPNSRRE
jgi:hypothetical protein